MYSELVQFYAVQAHALDEGRAQQWAASFTEDVKYGDLAGRAAVRSAAVDEAVRLAAEGVVRRRLVTNVRVRSFDDHVRADAYLLVVDTVAGRSVIRAAGEFSDEVVASEGTWSVRRRRITFDNADPVPL